MRCPIGISITHANTSSINVLNACRKGEKEQKITQWEIDPPRKYIRKYIRKYMLANRCSTNVLNACREGGNNKGAFVGSLGAKQPIKHTMKQPIKQPMKHTIKHTMKHTIKQPIKHTISFVNEGGEIQKIKCASVHILLFSPLRKHMYCTFVECLPLGGGGKKETQWDSARNHTITIYKCICHTTKGKKWKKRK